METACVKCGMPMMEYEGKLECAVCPVLIKKVKKRLKAKKEAETKTSKNETSPKLPSQPDAVVEEEMSAATEDKLQVVKAEEVIIKQTVAEVANKEVMSEEPPREEVYPGQPADEAVTKDTLSDPLLKKYVHEEESINDTINVAIIETNEFMEDTAADVDIKLKKSIDPITLNTESPENFDSGCKSDAVIHVKEKAPRLMKEEKHLYEVEQERSLNEARLVEEVKLEEIHLENKALVSQDVLLAEEKRRAEESFLLEETRRLELLEDKHLEQQTDEFVTSQQQQDGDAAFEKKARRAIEIVAAEKARIEAEKEATLLADLKKAEEEANLINELEEEAAEKQQAAEQAIARAKAALDEVTCAKKEILSSTIEQAEAKAIAEAEAIVNAEREDHQSHDPSAEEIEKERWATLRSEVRAMMTRRMIQGWTM